MKRPIKPAHAAQPLGPPLLDVLRGNVRHPPPLWLMRQAGRYLPEYRDLRARSPSFLEFCLTPGLALEASLQPIRRFGFDAAILFSDILVVPHALGQAVRFEEGQGPLLDPISDAAGLRQLSLLSLAERLEPVWTTVARLRAVLVPEVALIGFAGAPWTVATYMAEGGSSRDFATVKGWAYRDPAGFGALLDLLVEATVIHLRRQVESGAQAIQLFESWAGALPAESFRAWGLDPATRVIAGLKRTHPDVPVILFPRGAGITYSAWAAESGADCIGLDSAVPVEWAVAKLPEQCILQGNLDPVALAVGGETLGRATRHILEGLGARAFIFNLGHGVLPQTPPSHVEQLARLVRDWRG